MESPLGTSAPPPAANAKVWQKIVAYLLAWIVAFVATQPSGALFPLIWMYPIGLFAVFYPPALRSASWAPLLIGYGIYIAHACFYFTSKPMRRTTFWFAVLVVLLVCNTGGCRSMLNTH